MIFFTRKYPRERSITQWYDEKYNSMVDNDIENNTDKQMNVLPEMCGVENLAEVN